MKKVIIPILIISALTLFYLSSEKKNITRTGDDAVALIKKTYPEFKDYPSDNLPPKRIETIETTDGWRVGMYMEGSGLQGILHADCFLVAKTGSVLKTGFFSGEGPAKKINLATCTPAE
jgi:hypothetical protein